MTNNSKMWLTIFKMKRPLCTCGREMDVLDVTRYHKDYLILKATDELEDKMGEDFYIMYSIKDMQTFGQAYNTIAPKEIAKAVARYEAEKINNG